MRQNPKLIALLHSTDMTPNESRLGRYLRAPEGHPGAPEGFVPAGDGGTSSAGGNNEGGNSGSAGGGSASQNNSGTDEIDPAEFWSDPEPAAAPAPKPGSAAALDSGSQPQNEGAEFTNQLVSRIDNLEFEGVFSDDVAQAINRGDYKAANDALTANYRKAVKDGMGVQAQLLKKFSESFSSVIEARVEKMVNERLGQQQATDALTKAIPSASNPKVGPGIRAIYNHALTRTGQDHTKAIAMTKSMMRTMAQEMGADVNLNVAPVDPHAAPAPKSTNWLEELSAV